MKKLTAVLAHTFGILFSCAIDGAVLAFGFQMCWNRGIAWELNLPEFGFAPLFWGFATLLYFVACLRLYLRNDT